ncbi:MAG: hypothetical protein ACXWP5_06025, partial [Bdellovibrionota bacterium]
MSPSQRDAFEIYRRMRFGDPRTALNANTLEEITKLLKTYPNLEKTPFRNFTLLVQGRTYPVTKELATYLESQVKSAGQMRGNLFQVEANSGFWKKVFQFEEKAAPKGEVLSKEAAKAAKEEAKARWTSFLDERISPELRAELANAEKPANEKATALFRRLLEVRAEL